MMLQSDSVAQQKSISTKKNGGNKKRLILLLLRNRNELEKKNLHVAKKTADEVTLADWSARKSGI